MMNSLADKIVLNALKLIKFGQLRVINHDKREYLFGEENKDLKVVLNKIKTIFLKKINRNIEILFSENFHGFFFLIRG